MKLLQLKIDGFGKFNNQVFDVNSQNQLFFGENEAGKSTVYQFIRTILFGFPKKREMIRDFTPVNGAIYGGKIIFEDKLHGKITVERYKEKNKGQAAIQFENGQLGNELTLEKLLAPLTKETFDQIFSFQQEQLVELNQMNEVRLQHLLLTVGLTGSERLTKMSDVFLKERQKLFKPSGRIPEINQRLRQLKKLEQQIELVESQEATYQVKRQRMSELTQLINNADKDKNRQSELEKTILEQQKRFPMYIEWESLMKELSSDVEAPSTKIESVKHGLNNHRFLLNKEKELLESQSSNLEVESPAYQFYLENQSIFDDLLEDQLAVESMTERRQLLEEQLGEYRKSKETLYEKYRLSEEKINIDLSPEVEEEILALAKSEEELVREKVILSNEKSRLVIKQKDMDTQLTTVENQLAVIPTDEVENDSKKMTDPLSKKLFSGLSIAVSLLFLSLAVVLKINWIYIPVVALFGLGVYGFLTANKASSKEKHASKEVTQEDYLLQLTASDEVEHSLHELESQLADIEAKIVTLQDKKQEWADRYGFSMKETMTLWLSRIPIYMQLQDIQEKEEEMKKNLADADRVLHSYAELLTFSKQWIPIENKSTKEIYHEMKRFVDEQQTYLKDKAMASNNQQNFQGQLHSVKKQVEKSEQDLLALVGNSTVSSIEDVNIWLKKQELSKQSQSRIEELEVTLGGYFDLTKRYTLVDINHHLISVKNREDDYLETINQHQDEFQTLKYELSQMEKNGSLDTLYQERENKLSTIKELSDQWITNKIAEELTQDVFQYLSDQQLPALLATVTSYFKILTEGTYFKVFVKNNQLYVRDKEQKVWPIIQLSTGAKDQLYTAFRLAFIHLHTEDYEAPVIIDDGWLHFDAKRKLTLFKLLDGFSKQTQVICLSSDQAVKSYFETHDLSIVTIGRDEAM
ncbi:MAG: AAA family ATPase [Vagococcus sp.]|uniref:AAA family ATPase n=1 Tax=Vagococcus sp. TaxID=1933889 RepID=UPI002FCC3939